MEVCRHKGLHDYFLNSDPENTIFSFVFFSSTTILVKVLLTVSNKKQLGFTSTEREFVERILRYLTGYMEGLKKKKKSRPLKGKGQELVMKFQ